MKTRQLSIALAVSLFMSAAAAHADTKSWTGAVNNLWSVGGNWNGGVPPVAGDALVFPAGAANRNMNNDLPAGLALQSLSFTGAVYSLSGNGFSLSAGLSTCRCGSNTFTAPMTLTASQTVSADGVDNFAGPINLNGFTLTMVPYLTTLSGSLSGSGSFVLSSIREGLNLTGTSTFSGTFSLSSEARMNVSGSIANSSLTVDSSGFLSGNGTIPATSLLNATLRVGNDPAAGFGDDPHTTGILSTGNFSLQNGVIQIDLANLTPGTGHDQINTIGSVTLTNPALQVWLPSLIPTAGQTFVIINNDGTDAVAGTFDGLPEGATFTVGSTQFRISYVGGSGNDAVLIVLGGPKSWTGAMSNQWSVGGNWNGGVPPVTGDALVFPAGAANRNMNNYKVHSHDGSVESGDSNVDLATTVIFTDPTLTPGSTQVKAAHFTQMRTAVNAVQALASQSNTPYTDVTLDSTVNVKGVHSTELRTRLNAARAAITGLSPATFTNTISAGTTVISALDMNELRAGVQ